jgi:hypothetical protein
MRPPGQVIWIARILALLSPLWVAKAGCTNKFFWTCPGIHTRENRMRCKQCFTLWHVGNQVCEMAEETTKKKGSPNFIVETWIQREAGPISLGPLLFASLVNHTHAGSYSSVSCGPQWSNESYRH